jgi:hypothetical protein
MRWLRPVYVFTSIATVLVLWFGVRMGFGSDPLVWRVSCLLGAWAPLLGAVILAYVRAVGDREHTVGVAWLVRAIGMHCVLLWMIGVGDYLAGLGAGRRWVADVAAPLVLLGFAPVFLGCFAAVEWVRSVAKRVPRSVERPALPIERSSEAAFRGVRVVRETVTTTERATWSYVLGFAGITGNLLAPQHAVAITVACAVASAVMATRNARGFVPSLLLLSTATVVALCMRVSDGQVSLWPALSIAPWIAMAAIAALVLPLDLTLRLREAPARR